jgi:dihydroorotate dehydrogenase electron transfer subunit
MFFQECTIRYNKMIAPSVHLMRFEAGPMASEACPGQFVMVRPTELTEPLLPRPFSIHGVQGDNMELLFKVVGQGTRILSALKKGDRLEVRGPLGRGFRLHQDQEPILAAGGLGVAPLLFLARHWIKKPSRASGSFPKLFIGARTKEELLRLEEFEKLGVAVRAATEDGSFGEKGLVTRLLERAWKDFSSRTVILACGPKAMLKALRDWTLQNNISCQLSLETHMACGLGACLGCVVTRETDQGRFYVNVCQEGPVFEAGEVFGDA